jgi:EmrB/QacA subfamily drug resistance transporter
MFRSSGKKEAGKWAVLALLGVAQLMVVLDGTIVNTALPAAQRDLAFSTDARQWVITSYALAFGSLLLLGGKLGDLFGRKWTFVGGLAGFALASAIGGAADSFAVLVGARALQGAFAAVLAPSALGLLTVTFAGSPERSKAFGIFGAIAASGASVGLLLGGILTEWLSWRWCLWVNPLIALPTGLLALRWMANPPLPTRPRIDLLGAVLAPAGLFGLVFGFSNAEMHSWSAPVTIAALAAGALLLCLFVTVERRSSHPLLPLHVPLDRKRGGAYLAVLVAAAGMFAVLLFLTYYMQGDLGFSPLGDGVGFLPMSLAIAVTSVTVQMRILGRVGARLIFAVGMALATVGMLIFSHLPVEGSYAVHVLPGLVVFGVGMGCVIGTGFATATVGVDAKEAGVASAMVNTAQQIGGSIGTAVLSTVFASGVAASTPAFGESALVHGYTTAFAAAAGIFAVGFLAVVLILPSRQGELAQAGATA